VRADVRLGVLIILVGAEGLCVGCGCLFGLAGGLCCAWCWLFYLTFI